MLLALLSVVRVVLLKVRLRRGARENARGKGGQKDHGKEGETRKKEKKKQIEVRGSRKQENRDRSRK